MLNRWASYVERVAGEATQQDAAEAAGITASTISRWRRAQHAPKAQAVVAFARAFGRAPVEALVEAGYLTRREGFPIRSLIADTRDANGSPVEALVRAGFIGDIEARDPNPDTRQVLLRNIGEGINPDVTASAIDTVCPRSGCLLRMLLGIGEALESTG